MIHFNLGDRGVFPKTLRAMLQYRIQTALSAIMARAIDNPDVVNIKGHWKDDQTFMIYTIRIPRGMELKMPRERLEMEKEG